MEKTKLVIDHSKPVIEIRDVSKSFGDNHVLRGVNLDLYKEENLVVLGRSGTGKSVLIKLISGLLKPDQGNIELFGEPVT
jgi:phospholipid/cholesterol/gamma-HCH transport system ATP-binding protein